jgi:hypothetical protein
LDAGEGGPGNARAHPCRRDDGRILTAVGVRWPRACLAPLRSTRRGFAARPLVLWEAAEGGRGLVLGAARDGGREDARGRLHHLLLLRHACRRSFSVRSGTGGNAVVALRIHSAPRPSARLGTR